MYDNQYPNTNLPSREDNTANVTSQNQEQNPGQNQNVYGSHNTGGYYNNTYQNGAYNQTTGRNPYENRTGYYNHGGAAPGTEQASGGHSAGNTDSLNAAGSTNGAGSYQYGKSYPNHYKQHGLHKERKKTGEKPQGKPYWKKALVNVSLGLLFGICAGLGLYAVQAVTGMSEKDSAKTEQTQAEEAMADEALPEQKESVSGTDDAKVESGLQMTNNVSTIVADVSEVVNGAMPAIVSINNHYTERMSFFGEAIINEADASGSGIIVGKNDTELLIVTNHHVIAETDKLTVQFVEGSEAEASIKGTDADMDLAVLAVPVGSIGNDTMEKIAVATLGDSDSLVVGEPAIAIGNSLGYGQSVTTGVISALNRTISLSDGSDGTFIQTDAAINPGNSGGALLNMKGEVIGINSNKIGGSAVEGMGYAIPISSASPIIAELMLKETKNKVAEEERGYLGISGISVTQYVSETYGMPEGVYISQVYENTAAASAGLRKGDIITEFDGEKIASMDELQRELEFHAIGDTVDVTVMSADMNGYTDRQVKLTLGNKVSN